MMSTKITLTPKLVDQIGRGNNEVLKLINRQVAGVLGGEPTAWTWRPGWDEIYGEVMVVEADR